ncbi:MAG: HD domain-containing phosphohydrolase [Rhodospirillales bacterium]
MKIAVRLPVMIVACAVAASAVVGTFGYFQAREQLHEAAGRELVALRETRHEALTLYLKGIEGDIELMAKSPMVVAALNDFTEAFQGFGISQERARSLLQRMYRPEMPAGDPAVLKEAFSQVQAYESVHKRYHPWLHLLSRTRGYDDVFLLDKWGNVVYTAAKEADFATDLIRGKWRGTLIALAADGALRNPVAFRRTFTDFAPYAPSGYKPASFISEPIYDNGDKETGEQIGVLIFQMPISRINAVMNIEAGMGRSGETFLVGSDLLMRSDSRLSDEQTLLNKRVDMQASHLALGGETGLTSEVGYRGKEVIASFGPLDFQGVRWGVLSLIDLAEVEAPIKKVRDTLTMLAFSAAVLFGLIGLWAGRSVTAPLSRLTDAFQWFAHEHRARALPDAKRDDEIGIIARDFQDMQTEIESYADRLEARVRERTVELETMSNRLTRLVEIGIDLNEELDGDKLLETIVEGAKDLCGADGATLYRLSDDHLNWVIVRSDTLGVRFGGEGGMEEAEFPPIPVYRDAGKDGNRHSIAAYVAVTGEIVNVADMYEVEGFTETEFRRFDDNTGYRTKSFMCVPLKERDGTISGVMQVINAVHPATGEVIPFSDGQGEVLASLSSMAAVAMENQSLLETRKALLESFIQLISGAIDSKSPYTGGHCARVPVLAFQLAEEAANQAQGPFADFSMTEGDWETYHIASWLHDCGKVTTPEYVVDKATKLETIHNRLHEIRTRFEVLRRDAEIAYLKTLRDGQDDLIARARFEDQIKSLDSDFAFVANANVGGEFMSDDDIKRIETIAKRTWLRHFDNRLGLSRDELKRMADEPERALPVEEPLLADKAIHRIAREGGGDPFGDNPWGFNMAVPDLLYDQGEIKNLSIRRGTLTDEERFKINDHIIQTIVMLESLPWPDDLKRVPEYAGGHHEKLDGTGYPRGLTKEQMSVPARIMAVADVFEALTASDRPYKQGKTLSEAMKIMGFMVKDKHIDPDLFRLFVKSGAYKRYAADFLKPEQIDDVDESTLPL